MQDIEMTNTGLKATGSIATRRGLACELERIVQCNEKTSICHQQTAQDDIPSPEHLIDWAVEVIGVGGGVASQIGFVVEGGTLVQARSPGSLTGSWRSALEPIPSRSSPPYPFLSGAA